jgi:hypothetical protein
MPMFESVAIVSKGATSDLKARFGVAPEDSSTGDGINAGAGAGALAGAGTALACGPFVFLCATATVPIGALVGAVGGGLAGSASDSQKMPPKEQLLVLDELFVEISRQRTIHMEIRDTLEKQIPPDRLADTSVTDALIQLNLSDVRFTRTFSGKYAWTLKSVMVVTWNRNTHRPRHSYKIYEYTSRSLPLDDWVQNDGEILNRALDACVEGMVEQMVGDIRFKDS